MNFENIFSKSSTSSNTPVCPNPKVPIIVDIREKQSFIAANLFNKKANVTFEKLDIGDYLVGDTIIERKTYSDFVTSIVDRRMLEQLANLKKYNKQFLLIEGFDFNYKKFKVHENAIKGMLLSVAIDFQIPIIYTKDEADTSDFLIITARKYEKPKTSFSMRPSKIIQTLDEQKQFILEGFPGVGPVMAKKLIQEFGSIKNILNAPEDKLKLMLGKKFDGLKEILEK